MEALCSKHSSRGHMASSPRLRLLVIQKYFQMSKNDSPEVLGMPGKAHKSPKDLADDLRTSLMSLCFCIVMYKYEALPPQINNLFIHLTLLSNLEFISSDSCH